MREDKLQKPHKSNQISKIKQVRLLPATRLNVDDADPESLRFVALSHCQKKVGQRFFWQDSVDLPTQMERKSF